MTIESLISTETVQAYRETEFRFFSDTSSILRIAEQNEGVLDLYKAIHSNTCAFVTACNPLGRLFNDAENTRLQSQLADELMS